MDNELVLPEDASKWYLYFGTTPGNEKIVFGVKGDFHYTLHLGIKSGYLDIHKTYHNSNEQPTLFKIKHYTLMRFFAHYQKILFMAVRRHIFAQKINMGKLKKYNCVLIPMGHTDDKAKQFFKLKNKGRHIRMRARIPLNALTEMFIEPDDIIEHSADSFFVYSYKKGMLTAQGMIRKNPNNPNSKLFFFTKKSSMNKFHKISSVGVFTALTKVQFENKHAIINDYKKNLLEQYPMLIRGNPPTNVKKAA